VGGRSGRNPLQAVLILVDSSVWINSLRDIDSPGVRELNSIEDTSAILVGDLILMEVLMGARSEAHATRLRDELLCFPIVSLSDASLAEAAARNYRDLRRLGITIRKGMDLVIGTFCIQHGHHLLHDDRDFGPMVEHLGLKTV
jgi:predicted nucleic acid-binding protein